MKIKICGIRTLEIAQAAIDAGATHLGFVFFGGSPRNISPRDAGGIIKKLKGDFKTVIVTVNPDDYLIAETLSYFRPDYIQLHGSETPKRVKEIKTTFDLQVIKAIPVAIKKNLFAAEQYKDLADYIMFDAKAHAGAESPGGNATPFEWRILKDYRPDYRWILSGGLTPSNVNEALKITKARFVDVSSGVESSPGNKQISLIKAFIGNAKKR